MRSPVRPNGSGRAADCRPCARALQESRAIGVARAVIALAALGAAAGPGADTVEEPQAIEHG